MPTQIIQGTSVSTLINIFKVAPERQMEAVELLIEATDKHIRQLPGFISANFHLSDNGTRIVNYAQWETPDAWHAMLDNPECVKHIEEVKKFTEPDYHLYQVHSTHMKD